MKLIVSNKKAAYNYFLEDKFEAGIVLEGSEVKSLRAGKCSLIDAYVSLVDGEMFLKHCEIPVFAQTSSAFKPDPQRERKLLLSKQQILKLKQKMLVKGYTIVPTKVYFNNKNMVKLEIALAKGKLLHDKRETIKERDLKREMQREY